MFLLLNVERNHKGMKLNVEQRTKLFNLIRKRVLIHTEKINVVSSDHPNKLLIFDDDDYKIWIYYNLIGMGATTNDLLQIALLDKKSNYHIKFDSSDYFLMKNGKDYYNLIREINSLVFDKDNTDKTTQEVINQILKNF